MSDIVGLVAPAIIFTDLSQALTWCGWRIAQGVQEATASSPPTAAGAAGTEAPRGRTVAARPLQ
jgi:hypothetical protein